MHTSRPASTAIDPHHDDGTPSRHDPHPDDPFAAWRDEPAHDAPAPRTAMTVLRERGARVIAALLALFLVLPAGAWLVDTLVFGRDAAAVEDAVPELADAVALVTRQGCNGGGGTGSGFAVTFDGRPALLTNRHVVEGAAAVGLRTLDGGPGPVVEQVLLSTTEDVAVLVLRQGLDSSLRLDRTPSPGDAVRLVGFPGARPVTSAGEVTAVEGSRLLLTIPVGGGASGAPIVDEDGRVVAQVVARTAAGEGVAITADAVTAALGSVVEAPGC